MLIMMCMDQSLDGAMVQSSCLVLSCVCRCLWCICMPGNTMPGYASARSLPPTACLLLCASSKACSTLCVTSAGLNIRELYVCALCCVRDVSGPGQEMIICTCRQEVQDSGASV